MAQMGRYCKAYPVTRFRAFQDWTENQQNLNQRRVKEGSTSPATLTEDDFLYLQENLSVTDGVFLDQNIIFKSDAETWKAFCNESLGFQPPPLSELPGETAPQA